MSAAGYLRAIIRCEELSCQNSAVIGVCHLVIWVKEGRCAAAGPLIGPAGVECLARKGAELRHDTCDSAPEMLLNETSSAIESGVGPGIFAFKREISGPPDQDCAPSPITFRREIIKSAENPGTDESVIVPDADVASLLLIVQVLFVITLACEKAVNRYRASRLAYLVRFILSPLIYLCKSFNVLVARSARMRHVCYFLESIAMKYKNALCNLKSEWQKF